MSLQSGTRTSSKSSPIQDWLNGTTPPDSASGSLEDCNRISRPLKRKRTTRSCSPQKKLLTPPDSQRHQQHAGPEQTDTMQRVTSIEESVETSSNSNGVESGPLVHPQSSASQTSLPSLKRRRGSPSKKRLQWLGKPINLNKNWDSVQQLPLLQGDSTLDDLLQALTAIDDGSAFIPKAIKDKVIPYLTKKEAKKGILDLNLCEDPRSEDDLKSELRDLNKALKAQALLMEYRANEPSWGERVWCRILECAIEHTPDVSWHNITTALIDKDFQPPKAASKKSRRVSGDHTCSAATSDISGLSTVSCSTVNGSRLSHKVDYAISIIPKRNTAAAIRDIVLHYNETGHPATINQTLLYELLESPIAIAIEGKTPEDTGGPKVIQQLSTWIAAWHRRMRCLQSDEMIQGTGRDPLKYVLLIKIHGRDWWLYVAVDDIESNQICVSDGAGLLGSTASLYTTYKLLASLRALMKWADGPYRAWWNELLGVPASPS